MKKAWIENGTIRDICPGDPTLSYYPTIAAHYITDVPDDAVNGATLVNGVWVNPAPPAPPAPPTQAELDAIAAAAYQASVPLAVTMRQGRLALLGAGLLANVNNAIAGMAGAQGDAARIEWEFSSEVKRNQPLVLALGPTLGMTSLQLDALFIAAAKL